MAIVLGFIFYVLVGLAILGVVVLVCYGLSRLFSKEDMKIAVIAVAVFVIVAGVALSPVASRADCNVYPKAGVVVDISFDDNGEVIITVEDGEGYLWSFYLQLDEGINISLGDVFALLMWDAETPEDILDDEVLDAINQYFKAR